MTRLQSHPVDSSHTTTNHMQKMNFPHTTEKYGSEENLRSKVTQESCNVLSSLMVSLNNILYLKKERKQIQSYKKIKKPKAQFVIYFLLRKIYV